MTAFNGPALWASLPLPALLIGPSGLIMDVNPPAETFLNASAKSLIGQPLLDRLSIDAPMEDALARVHAHESPLFIAEADVTTGERAPVQCALQMAPLSSQPNREPKEAKVLGSHLTQTTA